jgi:ATP-dependent Lon protease
MLCKYINQFFELKVAKSNISINNSRNKMNKKQQLNTKNSDDIIILVEKKLEFFQDVIQKTILNSQKNKMLDILGANDMTNCINALNNISEKMKELRNNMTFLSTDEIVNKLQELNNSLSGLLKNFGTDSLEDLLSICFGNNASIVTSDEEIIKYELLKKYFHPTQYKVVNLKKTEQEKSKTTFSEDVVTDKMRSMDCFDASSSSKNFHMRVYGIKVYVHHPGFNKHLLIYGIVDDIVIDYINSKYISNITKSVNAIKPNGPDFLGECFEKYVSSLTLKEYLIYTAQDVVNKYVGHTTQQKLFKNKNLSQIAKDFILNDLYIKRATIMQLLISSNDYDNKYLAYLLYDLLSNDANGTIDTVEQIILFDSFPWAIKQYFREAMKKTIQYTNELCNFDINKIPLEQQICLMKTSDVVKEKAMIKLKEIKSKSEDSGSKARQYLDGLLKIPFNVYKKEPVMFLMDKSRQIMLEIIKDENIKNVLPANKIKNNYTSIEMLHCVKTIRESVVKTNGNEIIKTVKKKFNEFDKTALIKEISKINEIISNKNMKFQKINSTGQLKKELVASIHKFIDFCNLNNKEVLLELDSKPKTELVAQIKSIDDNFENITNYMQNVKKILDKSVYGHEKAKKQIERIIGQWINGEQDGYCFGFEGPPGVGKTSLSKNGLSNCLLDETGNSRPFAMIQMGGDSNGSTLHGHNYTYVGSTWGGIVQILIDKKCMNPIIFIDELDKISKTEHGREIVGILTHLLDPTQNDSFQDKYFSGIDLDLSKALFILSYNDVDSIDKILLDRIHRIKFSSLSLEDKLVIGKTHMLPEVYKKMGLEGIINISDDVLKFIIDEYTSEPGVRKFKEILFEIVGEINLDILKNYSNIFDYPLNITIGDIKNKYFKDKRETKHKKIPVKSSVGIINGLWANSAGNGGIIPIQAKYYPSETFLSLKLTGLQGETMRESMNVALTVAWNLTSFENREKVRQLYEGNKHGIHVHCPEGSVQKDGPSAGCAIVCSIYSLLNQKNIKNTVAITGEISLDGLSTEIGGLDLKFLGGIKGGVKEFIYPSENEKDYKSFIEKYQNTDLLKDIIFHSVNNIHEVFDIVFECD